MSKIEFGLPLFEIKEIDEAGYISGVAAAYRNMDHGGDVIMPGALTKTIAGRTSLPMLRHHDHKMVVGAWKKFDDGPDGLNSEGRFSMRTVAGKEAHALAEDGGLPALSIGYKTLRQRIEGKARQLHELALHEISLVPAGMNDRALVVSVKDIMDGGGGLTVRHIEDILRDADVPKALALAIASKAKPLLDRGEPEEADELVQFLKGLRA